MMSSRCMLAIQYNWKCEVDLYTSMHTSKEKSKMEQAGSSLGLWYRAMNGCASASHTVMRWPVRYHDVVKQERK